MRGRGRACPAEPPLPLPLLPRALPLMLPAAVLLLALLWRRGLPPSARDALTPRSTSSLALLAALLALWTLVSRRGSFWTLYGRFLAFLGVLGPELDTVQPLEPVEALEDDVAGLPELLDARSLSRESREVQMRTGPRMEPCESGHEKMVHTPKDWLVFDSKLGAIPEERALRWADEAREREKKEREEEASGVQDRRKKKELPPVRNMPPRSPKRRVYPEIHAAFVVQHFS